ncbi:MAG TPA: DUF1259 domain-containing protein [Acidobacteriota bacterium]|nr:DUF1259 domain-containing protein [Acidobacteriota bacterium]
MRSCILLLIVMAWNSGAFSQETPAGRLDIGATVEAITGLKVSRQDRQVKISVPQTDLQVLLDGWSITPPMGLSSWAAFAPTAQGAVVMGDFVVRENEIAPAEKLLLEKGLTVSGLHNHFVREEPRVMFMHIHGEGRIDSLAEGVKALIDGIRELRGSTPAGSNSPTVSSSLPTAEIERVIGHRGEQNAGVLRFVIGRPDVKLDSHGVEVTSFMGFNTWAAFQGTADRAAVAGDFAMMESEVEPVISALIRNDIEVVAVHNHMVHEKPRIFFLHYWGVGPATKLAVGLRDALAKTGNGATRQPSH